MSINTQPTKQKNILEVTETNKAINVPDFSKPVSQEELDDISQLLEDSQGVIMFEEAKFDVNRGKDAFIKEILDIEPIFIEILITSQIGWMISNFQVII